MKYSKLNFYSVFSPEFARFTANFIVQGIQIKAVVYGHASRSRNKNIKIIARFHVKFMHLLIIPLRILHKSACPIYGNLYS